MKVLKWNFTTPRQEFVDQLKEQVEAAGFNTSLQTMMFHSDFKQHLKAIDMLAKHLPSDVTGVMSNLDLIFKWVTLRFFETNPSVLLKSLEYLNEVFNALAEQVESLSQYFCQLCSTIDGNEGGLLWLLQPLKTPLKGVCFVELCDCNQ